MNAIPATVPGETDPRHEIYAGLMRRAVPSPNSDTLARMLSSKSVSIGAMPARLGLDEDAFVRMMAVRFPGAALPPGWSDGDEYESQREDERTELRGLLLAHVHGRGEEPEWMAELVVAGCMGGDHLWQDLGLWSRKDLSVLMQQNFPSLAAKNDRDMKWKKFLYKQLCDAEGIYVCRSPSCEVCPDFSNCFGPEE